MTGAPPAQAAVRPPWVSEADYKAALKAFTGVVGADWVLVSELDRNTYLDAFAPGDADSHAASAAVAPQSAQEVQAIMKITNKNQNNLWPVSTGRNLAYGGSAPVLRGSVVLDLKRMNRILENNKQLGYALVEPGVSFFELFEALQKAGGKLWISTPAPGWGSAIGNALEHGLGYTPYGAHADTFCGMEVVLPDGDLVRTGMGAAQGGKEWRTFKYGYGPVWDGLFTQSNFGVVTKMGVWLMPQPEAVAYVGVSLPNVKDLPLMVDTLRPLRLNDTINATYTIVNPFRSIVDGYSMHGKGRADIYQGRDSIKLEVVLKELGSQATAPWNATFNLFDRDRGLDLRLAAIQEAFARIPGAKVQTRRWHQGQPIEQWMRVQPGLFALGIVDWYGGPGGHMNFAPVVAPIGNRAGELYDAIYQRFVEFGIDYYCGLLNVGARGLLVNAVMFFFCFVVVLLLFLFLFCCCCCFV